MNARNDLQKEFVPDGWMVVDYPESGDHWVMLDGTVSDRWVIGPLPDDPSGVRQWAVWDPSMWDPSIEDPTVPLAVIAPKVDMIWVRRIPVRTRRLDISDKVTDWCYADLEGDICSWLDIGFNDIEHIEVSATAEVTYRVRGA